VKTLFRVSICPPNAGTRAKRLPIAEDCEWIGEYIRADCIS